MTSAAALDRGVFTLSLDLELIWGTLDLFGPAGFRRACEIERGLVGRLVDLLAECEIPATWCVLGHLFLERCARVNGVKHPEIPRPRHVWSRGDWFEHDPCSDEVAAPLFYGRSLLRRILDCRVPQEIGAHSFSHVIFGDSGCSRETAEAELLACRHAAGEMGLSLASFAFPRNSVGHLEVLRAQGFSVFRGPGPRWYEKDDSPGIARRIAHLVDVVRAAEPPVVVPETTREGLVNLPGSMILFPMHGVRRLVPVTARVRRAVKGLASAVRHRRVFHLWFHPTNLADETETMFGALREIFAAVCERRAKGELEVRTMGSFAHPSATPALG